MAEQVIICESACAVTIQHEFTNPLLNISTADAAAIGFAIVAVWAVGFGVRVLIQTLKTGDSSSESST